MRAALNTIAAALFLVPLLAQAQEEQPLTLELNKLEPIPPAAAGAAPGCRAYLVANNPDNGAHLDVLRLDLILFGTDGVIARRVALDIGPVQPGRTQVRLFDLRDVACEGIGQILINGTILCKVAGADQPDCMDRIRTSSRLTTKLTK